MINTSDVLYIGGYAVLAFLGGLIAFQCWDAFVKYLSTGKVIDHLSTLVFGHLSAFLLFFPVFLAHALPCAPSITLASDLQCPRHGKLLLAAFVCYVVGVSFGWVFMVFSILKKFNTSVYTLSFR